MEGLQKENIKELQNENTNEKENTKELEFIPNIVRVMKSSRNDKLYITLAVMTMNIVFSDIAIYAKAIIITGALALGILKSLSLIYYTNILKNPITINTETNMLSYFDEFSIKRKEFSIDAIKNIRVFYKLGQPYIFEANMVKEGKDVEENINLEAFDNNVVNYLLKTITEIKPEIEIEKKNVGKKSLKSAKTKNQDM